MGETNVDLYCQRSRARAPACQRAAVALLGSKGSDIYVIGAITTYQVVKFFCKEFIVTYNKKTISVKMVFQNAMVKYNYRKRRRKGKYKMYLQIRWRPPHTRIAQDAVSMCTAFFHLYCATRTWVLGCKQSCSQLHKILANSKNSLLKLLARKQEAGEVPTP